MKKVQVAKMHPLLVIMAHPDDAELWVGGTIASHAKIAPVYILVATEDKDRAKEALAGAKILGANLILEKILTVSICQNHIQKLHPEIIVTHRPDDPHPEHRKVNGIVQDSIIPARIETGYPKKFYTCDTYNSITINGNVSGSIIIDISDTFETKIKSLSCHKSQPLLYFTEMAKRLGNFWGARIDSDYAEAFDPQPILGMLPSQKSL